MPRLIDHPLVQALSEKRVRYLDKNRHAEAHGVAASLMIVLAFLGRRPMPDAAATAPSELDERSITK